MRAIIVGAGGTTRDLLRRLGELWDVTVVDTDPERLARARKVRDIEALEGDGSSRVVLDRAGLERADALVAATNDDSTNVEVCRIALETGLLRVVAVAADPERLPEYHDLDVPVFAPDSLAARGVEINLEPRRVSSTSFAQGKAEAIEFRIAPDSPVRGGALRDLHSANWLVAAILRGGRLIVPHGDTVLQTDDLVTVVGAAADFSLLVRTFTSGEARFPLDFGKSVVVPVSSHADVEGAAREAIGLVRNSRASSLLVIHRDISTLRDESRAEELQEVVSEVEAMSEGVEVEFRPVDGPPSKHMERLVADESVGAVVVPAPTVGAVFGRWRAIAALKAVTTLQRPVLFSRGTGPYANIIAPARDTRPGAAAARAAIDLAAYSKGAVTAVAAVAPVFLTGSDSRDAALRALTRLREEAAVQGVPVRRKMRQGNPVRVIEEVAGEVANLLVLGQPNVTPTIVRPGITGLLLSRVDCSVLVVPVTS